MSLGGPDGIGVLLLRLRPSPLVLAAIIAGAAGLVAVGATRVHEWVVMTDELLYAKLATAIGQSGSPLPTLHGVHVAFLGTVYPILLAPFYGSLDPPSAFTAAHVVNAVLMASAAAPAYLLARRVLARPWALAAALLAVSVPWIVLSAFVMSESAAYPVFLWTVFACQRALAEPSARRDLIAAATIVLAYFTRPQFLFLVAVLPAAILLTEVFGQGRAGLQAALRRHRHLAVLYAAGLVAVIPLAATGSAHLLLGDYGATATQGSLLPAGVWKAAVVHLDTVAVGLGVVPFLLGAGWALERLRGGSRETRALAALTIVTLVALPLEAASYDLRFGGAGVVRDRYLFYLAPLLFVPATAAVLERRAPRFGLATAAAFFAGTVWLAEFRARAGLWVDSPESVLNGAIHDQSGSLSAGTFVALCGAVLGAILLMVLGRLPRYAAAATFAALAFGFGGSVAGYAFERLLTSRAPSGLPVTGQAGVRDWVDSALPAGASAGLLAWPTSTAWDVSAVGWWEVEFWNRTATNAFVDSSGHFTYTPFPSQTLRLDFADGRFPGTESAPPYAVVADVDSRFALAGTRVGASYGLSILAVERPYRALWASRGLTVDGWTKPGRPARIRLYALPGRHSERVRVSVILDSPPGARQPTPYRLTGGEADAVGSAEPGTRTVAVVELCIPATGHADLALTTGASGRTSAAPLGPVPGPDRIVGLHMSGVTAEPTRSRCQGTRS